MKGAPIPPEVAWLAELESKEAQYHGLIVPGVHVFGQIRPMGRIRAYSSAGLSPFGGRGSTNEFQLLGHIHVDANGRVTRVEGFNGQEGERWAKRAEVLVKDRLAEGATIQVMTPLRGCAHTGIR